MNDFRAAGWEGRGSLLHARDPSLDPPKLVVVNPWHWLNEDGSFPHEPRLRKKSIRVAQFIESADEFLIYEWADTPWARGRQPAEKVADIAAKHGIRIELGVLIEAEANNRGRGARG